MSQLNFSFTDQTRESLTKERYETGIHNGNIITGAVYNDQYDSLDITFENPSKGWIHTERLFNPVKGEVPEWTTPEQELAKFQARVKHILKRFISEEECRFEADTFEDMCTQVIEKIENSAVASKKEFSLKVHYDKNFKYPELGRNRFMALADERPLAFSKWEKENRLMPESAPSSGSEDGSEEEIF